MRFLKLSGRTFLDLDDDNNALLTVPWTRIKTAKKSKKSFTIPLTGEALRIIRSIYARDDRDDRLVFPAFATLESARNVTRLGMLKLRKQVNFAEKDPAKPWVFYSLRNTMRSGLDNPDLGVDFQVAERALNHVVGSKSSSAYRNRDLTPELRIALGKWSGYVMALTRHLTRRRRRGLATPLSA